MIFHGVSQQRLAPVSAQIMVYVRGLAFAQGRACGATGAEQWHQRLRHPTYNMMVPRIADGAVEGLQVSEKDLKATEIETCATCSKAEP
jgi:hypothetical protein